MPTKPPFPGMNPYLESPYRWPEIHHALISEMARTLNLQIVPKCRAAIEARVYIDTALVGIPNIYVHKRADANARSSAVAVSAKPERVRLPTPCEVTEGYLEIREPLTKRVVTVVEVLSPANKRSGEGRRKYLEKRQTVLASATHRLSDFGQPLKRAPQRRALRVYRPGAYSQVSAAAGDRRY